MPSVVISSDGAVKPDHPCVGILRDAGFEPRVLADKRHALGLGTDEEKIEHFKGAVATLAWGERYTKRVLSSLPELRVVSRMGVGFDRVDIEAATANGKVITISPTANHEAVAEHALALVFALAKDIVPGDKGVRAGGWPNHPRRHLRGQTMGILGLGRIGRSLAVRAQAMLMKVIATEPYPDRAFVEEHGIELVDLDTLLARSDFVSVHLPLSDETRGIINKQALAKMKPDASIVNTARGGLIVEADLVEALSSGRLGGAGLDVFETEPTQPNNPLFELDNVIHCPHIAGQDYQAMLDMGTEAAENIVKLFRGEWPDAAVVNKELKGKWQW